MKDQSSYWYNGFRSNVIEMQSKGGLVVNYGVEPEEKGVVKRKGKQQQ